MALENVEDLFNNRLSLKITGMGDWAFNHDFF